MNPFRRIVNHVVNENNDGNAFVAHAAPYLLQPHASCPTVAGLVCSSGISWLV